MLANCHWDYSILLLLANWNSLDTGIIIHRKNYEQEACTAALQNIAVDKVAVKLDSGGCPNTRREVKSAWVQNRRTLDHTWVPASSYHWLVPHKKNKNKARKVNHQYILTFSFLQGFVWSVSRIYQLMFTFDSSLPLEDAGLKAFLWAQGQRQWVCNYIQTNA